MSIEPLVTVMIPTYNQEQWIKRAIESVQKQNYKNVEMIVSDDCSIDNTEVVVRDLIAVTGDSRIKYFKNNKNIGILKNYHETLHRSSGEFVVNLDGDDFFIDNNFFACAVAVIQKDNAIKLVFANYCESWNHDGCRVPVINKNIPSVMTDISFLRKYADGRIKWNHNTIFYRRRQAVDLGFYWDPEIPRNDWESFLRLVIGGKVAYLPMTAAAWSQHENNETKRADITKYLRNLVLVEGVASAMQSRFDWRFVNRWKWRTKRNLIQESCLGYLKNRNYWHVLKFLHAAWQSDPGPVLDALGSFSFMGRALLSIDSRVYGLAKKRFHK